MKRFAQEEKKKKEAESAKKADANLDSWFQEENESKLSFCLCSSLSISLIGHHRTGKEATGEEAARRVGKETKRRGEKEEARAREAG